MQLYMLDPLAESRWSDLAATHPKASVFHQPGWLKALAKTYRYRATALTSTPPGEPLSDGLVFCEVKSSITGNRLVSLPFTDHAELLLNENSTSSAFLEWLRTEYRQHNWRYLELRPSSVTVDFRDSLQPSQSFWLHTLDLTPSIDQLFRNFHKSCIQRRICHAERQGLTYEKGASNEILDEFYRLLIINRKRFRLLPQPRAWFQNLIECMKHNAEIRLVRKDGVAVAAILTLRHRKTVVYKYGCSDESFHHLAGMPFLFWRLIEESKAEGVKTIDFGRTDLDNDGLVRFKGHFGAVRQRLNYFRYAVKERDRTAARTDMPLARALFSILPSALSSGAGRLVYRHMG
ncbi:MAG TPA: peptidoglycan bridge formation glycyltransferase FemA/FemB family protein [Terracidiphilus sp.]|jgi:CelD/BcsL family acetyltransferase involved in cellulose biosynthesis|nr:peptidoglycan bridge formation glycyltransferase FemA/FemB family protein [Terracidiphilus sp.]